MEKRYGALRFIGTIYKILGVIVLILAVLAALGACAGALIGGENFRAAAAQSNFPLLAAGPIVGVIFAFFGLFYGAAIGLTLFAAGDFISLLLSLEENTRATATLLGGQPNPVVAAPSATPLAPR